MLDVAVAPRHIGAAGLLGRLHGLLTRMGSRAAVGALAVAAAVAALRTYLAAALVGAGHEVLGHALGVGQVGHSDFGGHVLLRMGSGAPREGGGRDHGQGRVEGDSALHGVLLVS
ncbi:hypothetical protein D3C71_1891540 [compost metagenome]